MRPEEMEEQGRDSFLAWIRLVGRNKDFNRVRLLSRALLGPHFLSITSEMNSTITFAITYASGLGFQSSCISVGY